MAEEFQLAVGFDATAIGAQVAQAVYASLGRWP
jgi:hypothetical protein